MAEKNAPKKNSSLIPILIGAVVVAAVGLKLTEPEAAPPKKRVLTNKTSTPKKSKDNFIEEDYKAKFEVISAPIKNSFVPEIAKSSLRNAFSSEVANGIPAAFAGGETTWLYTGHAEIDGRRVALLENTATGATEFLRLNQKWRSLTVTDIGEESITVESRGTTKVISLPTTASFSGTGTLAPLPVVVPNGGRALRGPIAGGPGMDAGMGAPAEPARSQPANTFAETAPTDGQFMMDPNAQGGNRGRRGRRG
jgi:hypothetical protein